MQILALLILSRMPRSCFRLFVPRAPLLYALPVQQRAMCHCNGGPDVLTKYDFCDMIRNIGNYLQIGKASHRRRLESCSKIIIVNVYINF